MKFHISYIAYPVERNLDKIIPEVSIDLEYFTEDKYWVKCFDNKKNELVCEGELSYEIPYQGTRQWYTNWRIEIYDSSGNIVKTDIFDLKGKVISIIIPSDAIGDNLAWFPYVEEFRKKHKCTVICRTRLFELFEKEYPEIIFIKDVTPIKNVYAQYLLGIAYDSNPIVHPQFVLEHPLQKIASDILGLPYKEIKPKITIPDKPRPIKEQYVCISEYKGGQSDLYRETGFWQKIVNFLADKGFKIVEVSLEHSNLVNIINLKNHSLFDTINYLNHCEFFISGSTGPAWLAWAVGKHVFMISDFTPANHEFQSNCTRLFNKSNPTKRLATSRKEEEEFCKEPITSAEVIQEILAFLKQ